MSPSALPPLLLLVLVLLPHSSLVHSHGFVAVPNPRGLLGSIRIAPNAPVILQDSEVDFKPHFPAGDKNEVPGSGKRSQERAAGATGWVPYNPYDPNFRWRAGFCGDEIGKEQEHMRGGEYYNGGHVSATYKQGQTIEVQVNIIAHHNGFMELHVCDVAKCGGEISRACFIEGHCRPLQRTKNTKCESGNNMRCGPYDRNYPGRWYMPCSAHDFKSNDMDFYGGDGTLNGGDGTILYDLPPDLHCEHCVMQWFWSSGNSCNPVGVIEYFDSEWGPNWGNCPGQGEAFGGVARKQAPCGGKKFPEEYLMCIDVRIDPRGGGTGAVSSSGSDGGAVDDRSGSFTSPSASSTPTATPSYSPISMAASPSRTPVAVAVPSESPSAYASVMPSPAAVGTHPRDMPRRENPRNGVIKDIVLVADGRVIQSVNDMDVVDISRYNNIALECLTTRSVQKVEFYLNARLVWTDFFQPYFMYGNRGRSPNYWKDPPVNRQFWLKTVAVEGSGNTRDVIRLTFTK